MLSKCSRLYWSPEIVCWWSISARQFFWTRRLFISRCIVYWSWDCLGLCCLEVLDLGVSRYLVLLGGVWVVLFVCSVLADRGKVCVSFIGCAAQSSVVLKKRVFIPVFLKKVCFIGFQPFLTALPYFVGYRFLWLVSAFHICSKVLTTRSLPFVCKHRSISSSSCLYRSSYCLAFKSFSSISV